MRGRRHCLLVPHTCSSSASDWRQKLLESSRIFQRLLEAQVGVGTSRGPSSHEELIARARPVDPPPEEERRWLIPTFGTPSPTFSKRNLFFDTKSRQSLNVFEEGPVLIPTLRLLRFSRETFANTSTAAMCTPPRRLFLSLLQEDNSVQKGRYIGHPRKRMKPWQKLMMRNRHFSHDPEIDGFPEKPGGTTCDARASPPPSHPALLLPPTGAECGASPRAARTRRSVWRPNCSGFRVEGLGCKHACENALKRVSPELYWVWGSG